MKNKKFFSIKIKDFQSLKKADLELPNGLTIVTGSSNNGKSAIVRAIESAVFNDGTDEFIRSGAKGLSVELDNGKHNVKYARKIKGQTDKTTYQFDDGEVQQKVGRTQLPEVEKLFNIREVRLQNNQRARLNFWYQNEKPFLMDKTAGQLYEFLSVSSSQKYLPVLTNMAFDIKQEDADIKAVTISIDMLKKELFLKQDVLDDNKGFYSLYEKLPALKKSEEQFAKSTALISALNDLQQTSCIVKESLRQVTQRIETISMDDVSLKMKRFTKESDKMVAREKLLSDTICALDRMCVVKENCNKVAVLSDNSTRCLSVLQNRLDSIIKMDTAVSSWSLKEDMCKKTAVSVKSCRERLKALTKSGLSIEAQMKLHNSILKAEETGRWLMECRKEMTEIMSVESRMNKAKEALSDVLVLLQASDKEYELLKQKLGACPFCGASFSNGFNHFKHI